MLIQCPQFVLFAQYFFRASICGCFVKGNANQMGGHTPRIISLVRTFIYDVMHTAVTTSRSAVKVVFKLPKYMIANFSTTFFCKLYLAMDVICAKKIYFPYNANTYPKLFRQLLLNIYSREKEIIGCLVLYFRTFNSLNSSIMRIYI